MAALRQMRLTLWYCLSINYRWRTQWSPRQGKFHVISTSASTNRKWRGKSLYHVSVYIYLRRGQIYRESTNGRNDYIKLCVRHMQMEEVSSNRRRYNNKKKMSRSTRATIYLKWIYNSVFYYMLKYFLQYIIRAFGYVRNKIIEYALMDWFHINQSHYMPEVPRGFQEV